MAIIQAISDHRTAVENLPAQALYNAITANNIYKLRKNIKSGVAECYIKVNTKTPITYPGSGDIYDCTVTGPAVYMEKDSSERTITSASIGVRTITNLISNKTHVASDNWMIYLSDATEYNDAVNRVIDDVALTPADKNHLSFTSLRNGSTVGLQVPTAIDSPNLEYSYDASTWIPWPYTTESSMRRYTDITLDRTERIYVRGEAQRMATNSGGYYSNFIMSGLISADGNIQSLVGYRLTCRLSMYDHLFYQCTSLVTPPLLPATLLNGYCYQNMFEGCTSLVSAPALPATVLSGYCYYEMFKDCTSLVQSPVLPATILTGSCYRSMFEGCTSLTSAPALPATVLSGYCYYEMFKDCTSLTSAPALPATTLASALGLADNCYSNMFQGCTSLVQAPALPATILADYCYESMFERCTSLEQAPVLPASELTQSCYERMFYECTSLIKCADIQNATTLAPSCCSYMYYGCAELNNAITPSISDWDTSYFSNWLYWVSATGVMSKPPDLSVPTGDSGIPSGWTTATHTKTITLSAIGAGRLGFDYTINGVTYTLNANSKVEISLTRPQTIEITTTGIISSGGEMIHLGSKVLSYDECNGTIEILNPAVLDMLCFTAAEPAIISMNHFGTNASTTKPVIFISTDNKQTFSEWDYTGISLSSTGDKVYMLGFNSTISSSTSDYSNFSISGRTSASGNIQSLMSFKTSFIPTIWYCYYKLFDGCTSLVSAPALSATVLTINCYTRMFQGCTSLTSVPVLPSTILSNHCYNNMFNGCTSLTQAPVLPATTLTPSCYYQMFQGCTSLTSAPTLPATTLDQSCYYQMFQGCTSLTSAPTLPATTVARACYQYMFQGCTSLVTAPELPATELAQYCYDCMFHECTSLVTAPTLPATTLATGCYQNMFFDCTSLTQAPELPATTLATSCYYSMFSNCTSLTYAPTLPATTLANSCYQSMFFYCTSLTQAPELPATTLATGCYQSMFQNCKSLTSAPDLPATTLAPSCYYYMFYGCTNYLSQVRTLATSWNANYAYNWLYNVAATGNLYCPATLTIPVGASGIPSGWTRHNYEDELYLNFRMPNGGDITLTKNGSPTAVTLEYLIEGTPNWVTWVETNNVRSLTLTAGQKVFIRNASETSTGFSTSFNDYYNFGFSANTYADGNVNSLMCKNPENAICTSWCYRQLFYECTYLLSCPKMPFTTLSVGCYSYCYTRSGISESPVLPATSTGEYTYYCMFTGCNNLIKIVTYLTNIIGVNDTGDWTSGVYATGDFYCDPNLTIPVGPSGIPSGWTRHSLEEYYYYGVRKDRSDSSTSLTRIGNPDLHRSLPIQSKMRRCLVLDDGTVNYYLDANNSALKENGTSAVLNGTHGQVMVEIPEHYVKYEMYTDSSTGHVIEERKISEYPLDGFTFVPKKYYSAFEAALDRTNLKLSSVINTTTQYRGGNNESSWDGTYRSLLGMPATYINLTEYRTYARNRGGRWTCHDQSIYDTVCNLYLIEYACTNCQAAFNSSLDANGYHQGGLGEGVTTFGANQWNSHNQYNPLVPCGATVSLGNNTGTINYSVTKSDNSTISLSVPSYRGIENLFGHLWEYADGILINMTSSSTSDIYKCYNPSKYDSTITSNYIRIGEAARSNGYSKNVLFPELISVEVGATSTSGWCDDFVGNVSIPSSGSETRMCIVGGASHNDTSAGIASIYLGYTPTVRDAGCGSRLCYHPTN